ncbi:MAG: capsule assembly Wzi family protein [Gemmatimonadaceae bacterium]
MSSVPRLAHSTVRPSLLHVVAIISFLAFPTLSTRAIAQSTQVVTGAAGGVRVGSDLDNYLRYLESLGKTPLVPWGIRGFSPGVVDSLTSVRGKHAWSDSWLFAKPATPEHFRALPLEFTERYNSSYAYGINDGPVWAGRGLTSSVSAGFAFAAGPLSAVVKPIAFRAENQAFAMRPNGETGTGAFRDGVSPATIDRPQRFGNGAYSHLDPGETTIRLDLLGASVGATSANEWWGPSSVFPYILGNNAAGVPRVFLGTQHETNIYFGTVQARVEYGIELQSRFSPVVGPDTFVSADSSGRKRTMSGLVVTFSPKIFPGLEIGAARYFHVAWTGHFGMADLKTPFEGLLKSSVPVGIAIPGVDNRDALKNQLASLSFRWVLPRSGVDLYGEFSHEDYSENSRALEVQPDLTRIYMMGFRKAFAHADSSSFDALRAEVFDANPTALGKFRGEGFIYVHYPIRQGHTEEGKVIGAGAGVGAPAAASIAWERFRREGRLTFYFLKTSENTPTDLASLPVTTGSAGVSAMRFTRVGDVTFDVAAVRSTTIPGAAGGWGLAASAGLEFRIP